MVKTDLQNKDDHLGKQDDKTFELPPPKIIGKERGDLLGNQSQDEETPQVAKSMYGKGEHASHDVILPVTYINNPQVDSTSGGGF